MTSSFRSGQSEVEHSRGISSILRRGTIAALVIITSTLPLSAQDKLLQVFHFNRLATADGLPTNEIRSNIVTDRQGFVWIGTVNGLARYDGHTCKVYRHLPDDPHSISSNGIMSLLVDSRGLLWVGTFDTDLPPFDVPVS